MDAQDRLGVGGNRICQVVEGKSRVKGEGGVRVGFILQANDWLGGRIYLRNLLAAVRTLHDRVITPVILTGVRHADASLDFPGTEIVTASQFDRKSLAWLAWKVLAKSTSRDLVL